MKKTEYRKVRIGDVHFIVGTDGSIDGRRKQTRGGTGYMEVSRTVNGKKKHFLVHRIVAAAWLEPPLFSNITQIDHINGDRSDNRAENLRWVTPEENVTNRWRLKGRRVVAVNKETGMFFETTTAGKMSRLIGVGKDTIIKYAKLNKPYENYFFVIGDYRNGGEG